MQIIEKMLMNNYIESCINEILNTSDEQTYRFSLTYFLWISEQVPDQFETIVLVLLEAYNPLFGPKLGEKIEMIQIENDNLYEIRKW